MKERIVVGMSGGVDSAVAAALLRDRGFEVIGVTMLIWSPPWADPRQESGCCGLGAAEDARRTAAALGIRHYVLDFQEIFYETVVENYAAEYRAGRTPNPCIRCNEFVKFGALLHRAGQLGAERIATGHYARVHRDSDSGRWLLRRAVDPARDQSYALYRLDQEQLSRTLFPLGEMTKAETRALAARLELPVAAKPDSQEVCFIPDNDYPGFLGRLLPETRRPGAIIDPDGQVLGEHPGIAFFTVGQRKGLGISAREPHYVTRIAPEANTITVATAGHPSRFARELVAEQPNWIDRERLTERVAVSAKIRYNMADQPAELAPETGESFRVTFEAPQKAVTPGQAVVCYRGDTLIGGGVIRFAGDPLDAHAKRE
jgi:tRNA-uridine 2-sulfurtransferase